MFVGWFGQSCFWVRLVSTAIVFTLTVIHRWTEWKTKRWPHVMCHMIYNNMTFLICCWFKKNFKKFSSTGLWRFQTTVLTSDVFRVIKYNDNNTFLGYVSRNFRVIFYIPISHNPQLSLAVLTESAFKHYRLGLIAKFWTRLNMANPVVFTS